MIRGIYTASAGMLCETIRQDIIANNLANVDTSGFKTDMAVFKELPTMDIKRVNESNVYPPNPFRKSPTIGQLGTGSVLDEVYTNFAPGKMQHTGNSLDVAIDNKNAFFVVESANGDLKYSRDGILTLDADGFLTNMSGDYVMALSDGTNPADGGLIVNAEGERALELQRIQVAGDKVEIDTQGRVVVDGEGQFLLAAGVAADRKAFRKEGANKFTRAYGEVALSDTGFRPGYVEKPNVSVIEQMVKMIEVSRAYEANSKSVQAHDSLIDKAVNTVGASRR